MREATASNFSRLDSRVSLVCNLLSERIGDDPIPTVRRMLVDQAAGSSNR